MPELREEDRATLEAARVAEPCERLQALEEAIRPGLLRFCGEVAGVLLQLLRPPGSSSAIVVEDLDGHAGRLRVPSRESFLEEVDDSLQLRLFLEVMSHEQLPSERRIKGFATERLTPVIEYLVLWHQFLLLQDDRIEITPEFGTDSADMHALARMKTDAAAKFVSPLLGWVIDECQRFCQRAGRQILSEHEQAVLFDAFEKLDWKSLGNFGRNRHLMLAAIRDTLGGQLVDPKSLPDSSG